MRPSSGCGYSRQSLFNRGEKSPYRQCSLVRPLPHPARHNGAGGTVLTHPDLAVQKIGLKRCRSASEQVSCHLVAMSSPKRIHPQASCRDIRITLNVDVIRPSSPFSVQQGIGLSQPSRWCAGLTGAPTMGLKTLAPNVVQFAHDVKRQLNEKVQHQTEKHQHQQQGDF